ncbi:hypothetical protein [Pararhizobium sp.]|uniref:hypothetical protein n=1 Tax=Pararhizobium sp. TaxID=1977563 RepID=UPI0027177725|nr:hypothetical protein [Pararhizobium sp.]MDO9417970.1 hypothetical protein [Pararhizobium sp.]
MTPEQEKHHERVREDAKDHHDALRKNLADSFTLVGSFSNAAMRAPALAAAAGIAGLLGFYSANNKVLAGSVGIEHFNSALLYLCGSVLLCVLAPSVAYLTQSCFTHSFGAMRYIWEHPFSKETRAAKIWGAVGYLLQAICIIIVLGSIVALIVGGWHFLQLANFVASTKS